MPIHGRSSHSRPSPPSLTEALTATFGMSVCILFHSIS
ncbi:hypothetical protein SBD_5925 [Streptomyces bottropensis ATCC 25435]|uniref:Uncharacterized protein n=1 Tax=Streptomyces bottropensis ATCC 25435 TaxID=1054862 RepID=M3EUP5_9ACTN|nr:hypothetical protein SBD_5925 [Streptomyces bottropensis ATCC 25435]